MQVPLRITFRGIHPSEAIEANIRSHAERLDRYSDRITGCQVVVEADHRHHRKGRLYHVRIDMTVPGEEIVVAREPLEHQSHQDVFVAIRDAFDAARRQLEDYVRRVRADVKRHEEPPVGRVARIEREAGYGFIETPDGREIYFHANSVLGDAFARLTVGTLVRFAEEPGEKGPQASTVHVVS